MQLDPAGVIALFNTYGYLLLLAIMTVEGPVITYLAAFVASLGYMNVYVVVLLAIAGNALGDVILYAIGRFGKTSRIEAYFKRKSKEKHILATIQRNLKTKTGRTLMLIKITPPHPAPGLMLAGAIEVPFPRFLLYAVLTSIPSAVLFALLGYYTGASYALFLNYFHRFEIAMAITASLVLASAVIGYVLWKRFKKTALVRQ